MSQGEYILILYLILCIKHLEFGFVSGAFSERSVRHQLDTYLRHESGQGFWTQARSTYLEDASTRKGKQFVELLDDAMSRSSSLAQVTAPDSSTTRADHRWYTARGVSPSP